MNVFINPDVVKDGCLVDAQWLDYRIFVDTAETFEQTYLSRTAYLGPTITKYDS